MQISYSQLTELTGHSYRTIKRRFHDAGLQPAVKGKGPGGADLWDSSAALRAIYAPRVEGIDAQAEKARLDKARADHQEMVNDERRGKLVPADQIEEAWTKIVLAAKTKLLGVPSKCAPILHDLVTDAEDRQTIYSAIDSLVREALTELAHHNHTKGGE